MPHDGTNHPPQQGGPTGALTPDQMADQAIAGSGVNTAGGPPSEIIGGQFTPGGSFDRFTPDTVADPSLYVLDHMREDGGTGIAQAYVEGDESRLWGMLTLEDRVRLQDKLVDLGLTNSVIPGEFDDGTVKGIKTVLALSNRAGTTWDSTMGRLQSLEDQGLLDAAEKEKQAFDVPTYLAPDYATMAQQVKDTFRQQLGRDPDQGEMAQLTAELDGWHKGSFDAQVGASRADFENRQTEGEQAGGTVRQVDPLSRFREAFESKYANEIDFVEDKQTAVETRETVEQGVGTLSQMSGA